MSKMKKAGLVALFAATTFTQVFGGTLTSYADGDVLIGFRKTGVSSDLVVDLGSIATFTNAAVNQRLTFTSVYTTNQLDVVGLNSLTWDAFTWIDTSGGIANSAILFVSQARSSLNTQASSPPSASGNNQFLVEGDMSLVQQGTTVNTSYNGLNTATAVLEPDNSSAYATGESYGTVMTGGAGYNFSGDFTDPQNCEQTTPSTFITGATVSRADFFWINPLPMGGHTSNTKYLGYFELNTNGVLSYVAYPVSAPAVPVIQSITRSGNVSSISFTTGNSGTYSLRGTNSAGLTVPRTNWPAITYGLGTGSVLTLKDTNSTSAGFYVITAQ
jgi:hypothetical protein